MVEIRLEDAAAVRDYFSKFADQQGRVLFRGQCRHYTKPDGTVNLISSFGRHGCIPPRMRRWTHYGFDILQSLSPVESHSALSEDSAAFIQALLQHYGWRSFFLDMTASPSVAAWFASYKFHEQYMLDASEDCHEAFVLLSRQRASYLPSKSDGHVYVLSVDAIQRRGLKCIDLHNGIQANFRSRFSVQQAWLTGPSKHALPADCLIARVTAPSEVFAEIAASHSLTSVSDVFPSRADDLFLKLLLAVPWESSPVNGGQIFRRGLPLPEYDYRFEKFRPEVEAFVTPFWASEDAEFRNAVRCATWFQVPEIAFYSGQPQDPFGFTILNSHVAKGSVGIEIDAMLRLAERHDSDSYRKGVVIERRSDDLIQLMSVTVDHPGSRLAGGGVEDGWFYRIDADGLWHRVQHPEQCACNNPRRHDQLFSLLQAIERGMAVQPFVPIADGIWRDPELAGLSGRG